MTLEKPFGGWTRDMHDNLVCGKSVRPDIPTDIPSSLRSLLEQSWAQRPNDRPNMRQVVDRLRVMEEQQLLLCNSPMAASIELPETSPGLVGGLMKGGFRASKSLSSPTCSCSVAFL